MKDCFYKYARVLNMPLYSYNNIIYEVELTPKIELLLGRITIRGSLSQFIVPLLTFIVPLLTFFVSLHLRSRCNELKWSFQRTEPSFCGAHFVLTNVTLLQGNGHNRVPILHMPLVTLFICYLTMQ